MSRVYIIYVCGRARVNTQAVRAIYELFARLNAIGHGSFAKGREGTVAVINKAPYHLLHTDKPERPVMRETKVNFDGHYPYATHSTLRERKSTVIVYRMCMPLDKYYGRFRPTPLIRVQSPVM